MFSFLLGRDDNYQDKQKIDAEIKPGGSAGSGSVPHSASNNSSMRRVESQNNSSLSFSKKNKTVSKDSIDTHTTKNLAFELSRPNRIKPHEPS